MISKRAQNRARTLGILMLGAVVLTSARAQSNNSRSVPKSGTLTPLTDEKDVQRKLEWYHSPVSGVSDGDREAIDRQQSLKPMIQSEAIPDYPREALRAQLQGIVKLALTISEQGMPEDVQVLESGDKRLSVTAMDAIRKWRWRPGYEYGRKVKYEASVEFTFKLIKGAPDATSAKIVYGSPIADGQRPTQAKFATADTATAAHTQGGGYASPGVDSAPASKLNSRAHDSASQIIPRPAPDLLPEESDLKPNSGQQISDGVYRPGNGVSAPTLLSRTEPEYSMEAQKARQQGTVVLMIIVDEQGLPQDVRVIRRLGFGLDEKAVEAVQRWRFRPAMKDGRPVKVEATIEVNFRQ
jgi:TonB family protein